jgi:hypothetical protein
VLFSAALTATIAMGNKGAMEPMPEGGVE